MSVVLVVEERAERHECDNHGNIRNIEKLLSAKSIDQNGCNEGGDEVHNANNDCAKVFVDGAASVFEDGHGVENNSVDTRELLEKHQAQGNHEWLQVATLQQIEYGVLRCVSLGIAMRFDDSFKLWFHVSLLSS